MTLKHVSLGQDILETVLAGELYGTLQETEYGAFSNLFDYQIPLYLCLF